MILPGGGGRQGKIVVFLYLPSKETAEQEQNFVISLQGANIRGVNSNSIIITKFKARSELFEGIRRSLGSLHEM
jgi:hypothetical protein